MSTKPPRTPDRSALGESWVMASTASIKDGNLQQKQEDHRTPELISPAPAPRSSTANNDKTLSQSSESLASSSWTATSGPELIMPSIYEAPISEASWIAPNMRSDPVKQPVGHSMRKRRKITSPNSQQPKVSRSPGADSSTPEVKIKQRPGILTILIPSLNRSTFIPTAINGLLLTFILHLLVLPEVIYQAQGLCNIPVIKSFYPDSCIKLKPQPSNPITPEETIFAAQTHLESIFTSSLATLIPLAPILKESESMLQNLESELQSIFPDARNALALEFQGSNQALRTAIWEFDSLRADLRSAVDSLLASPPTKETAGSSVARDTRLAAQLRRRAEYLDRLRAQIRGKTDALGTRFGTVDDHLEAVDGIISRETRRASLASLAGTGTGIDGRDGLKSVLDSLSKYTFGTKLSMFGGSAGSVAGEAGAEMPRPATTLAMLRLAATHHRPVVDSVERLSRQLRDLQRARGSTWVDYE